MTNLVDRFYAAVAVLAGDGHVKQRLTTAYQAHLDEVEHDALPSSIRKRFDALDRRMRSVAPLNGEGPICASVRKMSPVEAGRCAEEIVAMHAELLSEGAGVTVNGQPGDEDAAQVPPFLVKSAS